MLETTRLGIDVKNLKMRIESMSSRLDFDERRARALEGVVQYRPGAVPPLQPPSGGGTQSREPRGTEAEQAERRNRRRRRRGRGRRPDEPRQGGGGLASGGQTQGGGHTTGTTGPRPDSGREQAENRDLSPVTHAETAASGGGFDSDSAGDRSES